MFLRRVFFISLLSIFSLFVLGYGVYKALPIILGPKIELVSPIENETVEGTTVTVRGTVYRTKVLLINSVPTSFNEDGNFESKLAIYPGSNILIIEAIDRFDRVNKITRSVGTQN